MIDTLINLVESGVVTDFDIFEFVYTIFAISIVGYVFINLVTLIRLGKQGAKMLAVKVKEILAGEIL